MMNVKFSVLITSLVFCVAISSPVSFGQGTASDSDSTYKVVTLGITPYCYIDFLDGFVPPIEVPVGGNQSTGSTTTPIKFGANFNFKVKATLGWSDGYAPGEWRVTLNNNTGSSGWYLYGGWDDIGTSISSVKIFNRWFYVTTMDNTWDIFPYGLTTSVSPGSYDSGQNVTIQVRGIDLRAHSGVHQGGWLRIEIYPAWNLAETLDPDL